MHVLRDECHASVVLASQQVEGRALPLPHVLLLAEEAPLVLVRPLAVERQGLVVIQVQGPVGVCHLEVTSQGLLPDLLPGPHSWDPGDPRWVP